MIEGKLERLNWHIMDIKTATELANAHKKEAVDTLMFILNDETVPLFRRLCLSGLW